MTSRIMSAGLNWPILSLVCFFLAFAGMAAAPAAADIGPAARTVPAAELVGKGRMTYLGFKVFDAELYAPNGVYSASGPFALKLKYLRNFKGKAITESSVRQGNEASGRCVRGTTGVLGKTDERNLSECFRRASDHRCQNRERQHGILPRRAQARDDQRPGVHEEVLLDLAWQQDPQSATAGSAGRNRFVRTWR